MHGMENVKYLHSFTACTTMCSWYRYVHSWPLHSTVGTDMYTAGLCTVQLVPICTQLVCAQYSWYRYVHSWPVHSTVGTDMYTAGLRTVQFKHRGTVHLEWQLYWMLQYIQPQTRERLPPFTTSIISFCTNHIYCIRNSFNYVFIILF